MHAAFFRFFFYFSA
ncbi:pheST operon leader peptide PheM [Pantoea sp. Seng]|nr:pheST operon leader peptide PheM [Pantoea sp. Seng]MXP55740.1 pheST operon leader peptide PheM [Pantoea sp. Seng]